MKKKTKKMLTETFTNYTNKFVFGFVTFNQMLPISETYVIINHSQFTNNCSGNAIQYI